MSYVPMENENNALELDKSDNDRAKQVSSSLKNEDLIFNDIQISKNNSSEESRTKESITLYSGNTSEHVKTENDMLKNSTFIEGTKYETIDETVRATLMRDLRRILHKLEYVLLPRVNAEKGKDLQNWDLWGPLLICLILGITLSIQNTDGNTTNLFITVVVLIWLGAFIITLNAQFLGAKINIFQSICLLGYCIFPITIAAVITGIISGAPNIVKLIIVALAFLWSCFSSIGFMSSLVQPNKKMVVTYPIFLFFLFISSFVLSVQHS